jgi:uncharacterized membrane protein YjjP (DUF1212 family)
MNLPRRILLLLLAIALACLTFEHLNYRSWPDTIPALVGLVAVWLCLHFALSPRHPKH